MHFKSSTAENIFVTMIEGVTSGFDLTCVTNLPVVCDTQSRTACDLQLWMNYVDQTKFDRVVIKECNPNSNGVNSCDGCAKLLAKNPSFSPSNNKITWNIAVTMESKNLNYLSENFEIEILSNKNSSYLRAFWANIQLPKINVTNYQF